MQTAALVSVIIPVYNGAPYLGQALASVFAQTRAPLEVIVVDDGSTDASASVARQFPARYVLQTHCGASAARNHGVALAHGSFFAFLDADDIWMPEKLAWQTESFAAQSELEAVFGQMEQFVSPDRANAAPAARFVGMTLDGWAPGTMLIRRAAFERVGFFATRWRATEALEWMVRAREANLKSFMLPQLVLRRRVHANNTTLRERTTANREYAEIIQAALARQRQARLNG